MLRHLQEKQTYIDAYIKDSVSEIDRYEKEVKRLKQDVEAMEKMKTAPSVPVGQTGVPAMVEARANAGYRLGRQREWEGYVYQEA